MKTLLRITVLAVSLALTLPAVGAEPVKADGKTPPAIDATGSLLRELQQAVPSGLPLRAAFERLEAFQPTPATAAKLRTVFGTEHPYLFARQPDRGGRAAWRATLLPLHYQSAPGSGVEWDAATLDLTLDRNGNGLDFAGAWPRLSAADANVRMTVSGMTLNGRQRRGFGGVWYGGGEFGVASLRFESGQGGGSAVEMRDLRARMNTTEHPKTADIAYDARIGAIDVAGERIEEAHVGIRIVNIDKKLLADAKAASDKQQAQAAAAPPTRAQQLEAMKPLLRAFGRAAIARSTAIEIDDISARFRGNTASIHGQIAFAGAGARADELDDMKTLARRIVAHFEVKVPLALVRDVSGIVAARQASARAAQADRQGQPAPAAPSSAAMGQTITDVIVGKLVGGGYAKVENDALVSTIEWRDGRLTANGKPVALPAVAPGAAAPALPKTSETVVAGPNAPMPAAPLPADALQARLVDGSCSLPAYPAEAVAANAQLTLVVNYRVDAAGKVRDAFVAVPSAYPAWDQAALAALSTCTYVPALQAGQPFEVPMTWTIRREPGSARP